VEDSGVNVSDCSWYQLTRVVGAVEDSGVNVSDCFWYQLTRVIILD